MGAPFIVLNVVLVGLCLAAFASVVSAPTDQVRPPGRWFWAAWMLVVPGVALGVTWSAEGPGATIAGKSGSIGDVVFGTPSTPRVGLADELAGTYGVRDTVLVLSGAAIVALVVFHLLAHRRPALRRRSTLVKVASVVAGAAAVRLLVQLGFSDAFVLVTTVLAVGALLVWGYTMWLVATADELVAGSRVVWTAVLVATLVAGVAVGLTWTGDHAGRANLVFWLLWAGVPLAGLAVFHWMALPAPALRDVRVLRVVSQLAVLFAVVAVASFLADNLLANLADKSISTTFQNLEQPTQFVIQDADFRSAQPIKEAVVLLVRNTLAIIVVAIPLTLVIGTLIGIARLSTNWLLGKLAAGYVELFRNIPVLTIIIFFSAAVILPLPRRDAAWQPLGLALISNQRMSIASPVAGDGAAPFLLIALAGIVVGIAVAVWRTRRFDATGAAHHRVLWFVTTVGLIWVVAFIVLGAPISLSRPSLEGLSVVGGFSTLAPYVAVTLGLIIYTASHVAEIVRGSILAVPRGQTEAANAVALSAFQRYRFVVLPQAMRIAVPSLINQGLNLTKNSSLAIAVGYADITFGIFTAIGNANPAPQLLLILMAVYLGLSLIISFVGNVVNRRLQLVTN